MIFFVRFSSSTISLIWQPKNARQTLGDELVCISNLQHYALLRRLINVLDIDKLHFKYYI
jgi:hypothetical protein